MRSQKLSHGPTVAVQHPGLAVSRKGVSTPSLVAQLWSPEQMPHMRCGEALKEEQLVFLDTPKPGRMNGLDVPKYGGVDAVCESPQPAKGKAADPLNQVVRG